MPALGLELVSVAQLAAWLGFGLPARLNLVLNFGPNFAPELALLLAAMLNQAAKFVLELAVKPVA